MLKVFAEDIEVKNSKYQDALELSTARANNVIRELVKYKVPHDRLYSSGFGSSNLIK
jgi:chemotaxis protein MotB